LEKEGKGRKIFEGFRKIQSTITFSFSLLIIATVVIFLGIALNNTRKTILDSSISYTRQIIRQVNYDIDSYITNMENISSVIVGSPDVSNFLFPDEGQNALQTSEEKDEDKEKYGVSVIINNAAEAIDEVAVSRERILSQFKTITESRGDIYNIAAVANSGRAIVNDGSEGLTDFIDVKNLDWYKAALDSETGIALSSSHVQNAIVSSYKWVITLSRAIYGKDGKRDGVFFIDLNYNSISDLCNNNPIGTKGYIFIIDDEGNVVYHPKQQLMYGGLLTEKIPEILENDADYMLTQEGSASKLYTMSKSEKTGWIVVGVTFTDELLAGMRQAQRIYLIVAAGLLIIVILLSAIISRRITKPIAMLRDSMRKMEEGSISDASVEITTQNEIGDLSRSFNAMTVRIRELMSQIVYEQDEKRKSELRAMLAQINPHFLYNTLDSIIWMAESGRNKEVVVMTAALARLFRQSISNDKEQMTIEDELEYVRNYLTIQKMRYADKLEYSINVDSDILKVDIIKFALQPLVENAIYHGIKYKEGKGTIEISGHAEGDRVVLSVSDDGVGMDDETLSRIFDGNKKDERSNGVGITNVQSRIKLYYGEEYGLEFASEKGKGTVATLTIPREKNIDEN
jgi:two-component system sensor histidine kinase YesM